MPAERYYYPHPLKQTDSIQLVDQEFHHLINVMRSSVGDAVEIVNGLGQLAFATVIAIEKKRALLQFDDLITSLPPEISLILAQAIPRQNRLDNILEKGTELGVTEIWLFPGEKSEKKPFSDSQVEKLKTTTVSAMKQCGRLFLPIIKIMPSLNKWTGVPKPAFFGDVDPKAATLSSLWNQTNQSAMIFIGPESGFSDNEEHLLKKLQVTPCKLHPNILRTDTAAIASLSLLSHWLLN